MSTPAITITVRDAFRVTGPGGVDLTPSSRKACGVLALLAFAPDHRRPRDWIASMLWSDRAIENARASARQDVRKIKRGLGPHGAALLGEGETWLGLDPAMVTIDDGGSGRLLDGLVIRDPAFREWLAHLRAEDEAPAAVAGTAIGPTIGTAAPAPPPASGPPSGPAPCDRVVVRCVAGGDGAHGARLGDLVAHQISEGIEERIRVGRLSSAAGSAPIDVEVRCNLYEGDGVSIVLIEVVHPPSGTVLHARQHRLDGPAAMLVADESTARMAQEAAEIAVEELPHVLGVDRPALRASAYGQIGLSKLFSFDASAMEEADRWLRMASEAAGDGIYDAWRGLGLMLHHVDLGLPRTAEMVDLVDGCVARAFDQSRRNAATYGLVAFTRLMFGPEARDAAPLAARAAELMPSSPLSLIALSSAHLRAGRVEEAYNLSRRAMVYAQGLRFAHWWNTHHCVACVASGRHEEAAAAARAALAVDGKSVDDRAKVRPRAAYRHLIALEAARGNVAEAHRLSEALARIEPGFSLDRMLRDPDYPARTLRQTGLLQAVARLL